MHSEKNKKPRASRPKQNNNQKNKENAEVENKHLGKNKMF